MDTKKAASADRQHNTTDGNFTTRINRSQRFTRHNPCPVCNGNDQGTKGSRCWGFLSGDGRYAHCTRSEYSGKLLQGRNGTFPHLLNGHCRCGEIHSGEIRPVIRKASPDERERLINWLNTLTDESKPVTPGDPVDQYLKNRGINLESYPDDLRCHPHLPYREDGAILGHYPVMLAVIRDSGGHPVGFHRTYITSDGKKAPVPTPKKMTPLIGRANAIQLAPPGDVLVIAEGVETTLSFGILSGLPVWSCLSSGGIERFCPPPGVKKIVIGADYDKAGIESARVLIDRMAEQGIEVKAVFPDSTGEDWNDVLKGVIHA
ncbi:MAG: DUF7146 domain-containing protein [Leptospirales bacterium]